MGLEEEDARNKCRQVDGESKYQLGYKWPCELVNK